MKNRKINGYILFFTIETRLLFRKEINVNLIRNVDLLTEAINKINPLFLDKLDDGKF